MKGIVVYAPGACPPAPGICRVLNYVGSVAVKTSDGTKTISQFTTDKNGEFSLAIGAGTYFLESLSPKFNFPANFTQKVNVVQGVISNVFVRFGGY